MPSIVYTFSETGADGVASAFRSIGTAADSSAASVRRAGSSSKASSKASADGASRASRAHKDEFAELTRKVENQKKFARSLDSTNKKRIAGMKAVARAHAKAERDMTRATEKAARKRAQINARRGQRAIRGLRVLGGVALVGGAFLGAAVGAGVRRDIRLRDRAQALAVRGTDLTSKDANGNLVFNKVQSGGSLSRDFRNIALRTPGVKAADLERGASQFVEKTGNLAQAKRFAPVLGRVGLATGADQGDLGGIAADFVKKFGITSAGGISDALSILAVQGKRGQFELADSSKQFPKIAAAASRFGVQKGAAGVAQLGGLTQIARNATRSGSEAGTAVENFFRELTVKSKLIKKKTGIDVFTDESKTQARDFTKLIPEIIAGAGKKGGDVDILQKIFGARGIRAVSTLITIFNDVTKAGGSNRDAMDAVTAALNDSIIVQDAAMETQRDAAIMSQTTAAKMTAAGEAWDALVSKNVTPAVQELVTKFLSLATQTDVFDQILSAAGGVVKAFVSIAEVAERLGIITKSPGAALERKKIQREKLREDLSALQEGRRTSIALLGGDVDKTPKGMLVAEAIREKRKQIVDLDNEIRPLEAAADVRNKRDSRFIGKKEAIEQLQALTRGGAKTELNPLIAGIGGLPLRQITHSNTGQAALDAEAVQDILESGGMRGPSDALQLPPEKQEILDRLGESTRFVQTTKGDLTPEQEKLKGDSVSAQNIQGEIDKLTVTELQIKLDAINVDQISNQGSGGVFAGIFGF